jgi:hypothetical protein
MNLEMIHSRIHGYVLDLIPTELRENAAEVLRGALAAAYNEGQADAQSKFDPAVVGVAAASRDDLDHGLLRVRAIDAYEAAYSEMLQRYAGIYRLDLCTDHPTRYGYEALATCGAGEDGEGDALCDECGIARREPR